MFAGRVCGIVCAVMALCAGSIGKADDGYITGVGGAVRLMKGHPTIRMVSEEVHIYLPEGRVSASFVFKNEGPATTVEIGFPEEGKDVDPPSRSHMVGFQSWVDGQRVRVTRQVAEKPTVENDYEYSYFWVKKVSFGRGQTRTIVDRYTGGLDVTDAIYHSGGFSYVLKTGASWHGPIDHAKIVCHLGSVANYGPISFLPEGGRRKGNTITWDLYNIEPKQDVLIDWYKGFSDLSINGQWLWKTNEYGYLRRDWSDSQGPAPFRAGTELWVPVRIAAQWLDADLEGDPAKGTVTLARKGNRMSCTIGRAELRTKQGAHALPDRVIKKHGVIYIPFRGMIQALDGKSHYDRSGRLLVTLPEK